MPSPDPLPNPAEQLGAIVTRLYQLATNSKTPPDKRPAIFLQAHYLRGDLMSLVAMQFSQATEAYTGAMAAVSTVTDALDQAEHDIQKITDVVNGAAQLATSIDNLLKEATEMAAKVGMV